MRIRRALRSKAYSTRQVVHTKGAVRRLCIEVELMVILKEAAFAVPHNQCVFFTCFNSHTMDFNGETNAHHAQIKNMLVLG